MRSLFLISRALNARKRKIFALFFALAASVGISGAKQLEVAALQVGNVIMVGDQPVNTCCPPVQFGSAMIQDGTTYELIRATVDDSKNVTEAADGPYYVLKASDGTYFFKDKEYPVTAISDGLVVMATDPEYGDVTALAVHEPVKPKINIAYVDSLGNPLASEQVEFNSPEAPEIEGFTFVRWDVLPGALKDGFKLQAVYTENTPSGAPAKKVGKFTLVRKDETNEYILETDK